MPVQPSPKKFTCASCGWSKTVSPASDVIIIGFDHFDKCPKCGSKNLTTQTVSTIEAKINEIVDILTNT